MAQFTQQQIRSVVQRAAVYCPASNSESVRIDFTESNYFVGVGEETGEEVTVYFKDIDLEKDSFYELALIEV